MTISPILLIYIIGYRVNGIQAIVTDTALEATARLSTNCSEHFHFTYQVFGAVMDMSKTVDSFTSKMGFSGKQSLKLRSDCHIVRQCCHVDMMSKSRMVGYIFNLLSKKINSWLKSPQALSVFLPCFNLTMYLLLFGISSSKIYRYLALFTEYTGQDLFCHCVWIGLL